MRFSYINMVYNKQQLDFLWTISYRKWMLSETACKANAFGMTYLGEKALWGWLYARMTKYWIAQMKQYLELILGIQSIVSLAVLALQRFMMVTRDRQVAFLCRYIGCAEKTHPSCCCDQRPCMCLCSLSWLVPTSWFCSSLFQLAFPLCSPLPSFGSTGRS